jgi:hypothetical protein
VRHLMSLCCKTLMTRWHYHQGDALAYWKTYDHNVAPVPTGKHSYGHGGAILPPDYVYIDASHTEWFGHQYGETLLRKLRNGTYVSIHDAYRDAWSRSSDLERWHFSSHPHRPMPELQGAFAALQRPPALRLARGFTPSRTFDPELAARLQAIHDKYMHDERLTGVTLNPTVYFEIERGV